MFHFEKWWLEVEGFEEMVKRIWQADCPLSDPLDNWQYKIRLLRKKVMGWSHGYLFPVVSIYTSNFIKVKNTQRS
jgi:hypothetical protein